MNHSKFSCLLKFYSTCRLQNAAPGGISRTVANSQRKSWKPSLNNLYRQISAVRDHDSPLSPILDQWIQQGRPFHKNEFVSIIKELRFHNSYRKALQVSMWLSDKRYINLLPSDVSSRLDLIAKVHGTEQAENYFNNIPKQLKDDGVYAALLNCYTHAKQLEKAEAIMQKMKDLGLARTSLVYNILLNLYYQTGNQEKFDALMSDMEKNGISCDKITYGIRLSVASASSDLDGVDKILEEWESNSKGLMHWNNYAIAANAYAKAGDVDKALELLKKSEELIQNFDRQRKAYENLMTQYAVMGKKDDALRLWKHYKKQMRVYNTGYRSIITSLLKGGDTEYAEEIFKEWESDHSYYDMGIPNSLISAYAKKGLLDNAEAIIDRIKLKGVEPTPWAWTLLAKGYLDHDQIEKAVESLKESVLTAWPNCHWKPDKDVFISCLEYLKAKSNLEGAEELIEILGNKNIIPINIQERLLNHIKNKDSNAVALGDMEWHCPKGDEEKSELSNAEKRISNF